MTIRIRRTPNGPWVRVPLLAVRLGWCCVDDGNGPLWVAWACCHWADVWVALLAETRRN